MIVRGQNGTTIVTMGKGFEVRKSFLGDMNYGIWQRELCLGIYDEYMQAVNVLNEIEAQYVRFLTEGKKKENAVYRMPRRESLPGILDQAYVEVRNIMERWSEG